MSASVELPHNDNFLQNWRQKFNIFALDILNKILVYSQIKL